MPPHIPDRAFVRIDALKNGAYQPVGRVTWSGGIVGIEGDPAFVADLRDGIEHPVLRERVTPADGYRFLVLVSERYQSPSLLATPVTEE